jgi:hypothetical protein
MFAISPVLLLVTIGIVIIDMLSFNGLIRHVKEGKSINVPALIRDCFFFFIFQYYLEHALFSIRQPGP